MKQTNKKPKKDIICLLKDTAVLLFVFYVIFSLNSLSYEIGVLRDREVGLENRTERLEGRLSDLEDYNINKDCKNLAKGEEFIVIKTILGLGLGTGGIDVKCFILTSPRKIYQWSDRKGWHEHKGIFFKTPESVGNDLNEI